MVPIYSSKEDVKWAKEMLGIDIKMRNKYDCPEFCAVYLTVEIYDREGENLDVHWNVDLNEDGEERVVDGFLLKYLKTKSPEEAVKRIVIAVNEFGFRYEEGRMDEFSSTGLKFVKRILKVSADSVQDCNLDDDEDSREAFDEADKSWKVIREIKKLLKERKKVLPA